MEDHDPFPHLGRRDFIKYSMMAAGTLALPSVQGCATPGKKLPVLHGKGPLLIKNARCVDVVAGRVVDSAWVIVDGGLIAAMGSGPVDVPRGGVTVDLKNRFLIPGLIDAHCHSTASPAFSMRSFEFMHHVRQQKRNYMAAIASGVTTIRDMGAFPGLLHRFIRDIESGDLPGPRVVYCNSMLNIMGGHPEIDPSDVSLFARPASWFIGNIANSFMNDDEMMHCLEENARGGSFIKLTLDNRTIFCKRDPKIPVYSKDQLDRIFRFSKKTGLPVVGHHQFKFGFDRALEYPFHSIEHMATDAVISEKEAERMARQNLAIVPTLTMGQSFLMEEAYDALPGIYRTPFIDEELRVRRDYFKNDAESHCDPLIHRKNLEILSCYKSIPREQLWERKKFLVNPDVYFDMILNGVVNLRTMKDAGVLIGCGIDAGMPFNYFGGNYREYELLHRVGFSNADILRCATVNNAEILRMADKIGALASGKFADMVVLDQNPLDDIRALRSPRMVFKQGVLMASTLAEGEAGPV